MSTQPTLKLQTRPPIEIRPPPAKPQVKPQPIKLPPPPIQKGLVKCLLIGINYESIPYLQLYGCINDVLNVEQVLRKNYPRCKELRVLTDRTTAKPTRQNILAGIQWLVGGLQPGQNVYIHFSGHGGKIKDANGDEVSGEDSCIHPLDGSIVETITDDEIRQVLSERIPVGCKCFAVFDSCNSGSAMDLRYCWQSPSFGKLTFTQLTNYGKTRGKVVYLSGCRDDQYAMDTVNAAGIAGGALTNALVQTWKTYTTGLKVKHLLWDVRKCLKDNGYEQIPQISSGIALSSEESLNMDIY